MPSQQTTAPTEEPITLADAKTHLRVDYDEDDILIAALITSAREQAESICRRALVTQSWKVTFDKFPAPGMNISSANWYGPQWGIGPGPLSVASVEGRTGYEITLPFPPLQTVDSIKYYDATTQLLTTLDPSQYLVDAVSEPARITPAYGTTWPATLNRINAVEISFTAGYGAATAVPEGIKRWMLVRIGALYANREEVANRDTEPLPYVDSLLDPFRVITF